MSNILHRLFLSLLSCFPFFLTAQCISPTLEDSCTGTESLVVNNEVLNAGTKKYYYGATTSFSDLRLNGGTLVVCGDLTVDRFSMDSGKIVVRPGARFVIGNGIGYGMSLRGNSAIHNFGRFEVQRNLSLENAYASASKPNIIYNSPGSSFRMANQYFVINNPFSFFINKGTAEFHGIITEATAAAASICLGLLSKTRMTVMYNRRRHSYVAPEGSACLNVSQYTQLYDTLTQHQAINLCLGSGHTMDNSCIPWGCRPNAWGTTRILNACASCEEVVLLSLNIENLKVNRERTGNVITWRFNDQNPQIKFIVQSSTDGINFVNVDSMSASFANSSGNHRFLHTASSALLYYRIALQSPDGFLAYSEIKKIDGDDGDILVYPNPFVNNFSIATGSGAVKEVRLLDMHSRMIWRYVKPPKNLQVNPPVLPAGIYILELILPDRVKTLKLVRSKD